METLLIVILLVVVLDIASVRWGYDSTEKLDSPEWERRVAWRVLKAATPPGVKRPGEREVP